MINLKGDLTKAFFDFVDERHRIYVRRFIEQEEAPWTHDPVLAKYKFCNIYRELDRGTLFYLNNIAEEPDSKNLIFKTYVYRLINTIKIFEDLGIPELKGFNAYTYTEQLRKYKEEHGKIFNPAYRIFGTFGRGDGDAISELNKTLTELVGTINGIEEAVFKGRGMREAWLGLQEVYRVGPFIAYEIICDLLYTKRLPYQENDFANAGPGALWGLEIIFGKEGRKDPDKHMRLLLKFQDNYLPAGYPGRRLNLRDIESSLCEFRKYYNLSSGKSHGRLCNPQ